MGHKLDKGIEADRRADDAPSRRKSKGKDALVPQRRVSIHDAGEKGPAQTGERGRYLWVGENGLLGAELTCCVSRSTPTRGAHESTSQRREKTCLVFMHMHIRASMPLLPF